MTKDDNQYVAFSSSIILSSLYYPPELLPSIQSPTLYHRQKIQYTGAMKFLHTGDLHLGKSFHERSLIQDQEHFLNQLIQELVSPTSSFTSQNNSDKGYHALIIAGDVYDRAVPPPEAVALFDSFLTRLKEKLPDLHIIIIPGNHDSLRRLAFAASMLKFQRIHIASTMKDVLNPTIIDSVAFYSLPFMNPNFLQDGQTHQQAMIQTAIQQILQYHNEHHPQLAKVLVAHLFTQGAISSDSERVFIGTVELVEGNLFQDFDYVDLGHLHRCQNPGGKQIWYSGSPLAYSFSEAGNQNAFLQVELAPPSENFSKDSKLELSVTKIPVQPLHQVCRLEGSFEDFYQDKEGKYSQYKDCYLEISSTDLFPKENPITLLQGRYPYLLSYRQDLATANTSSATMEQRRQLIQDVGEHGAPTAQLFTTFMEDIYHELPENFSQELELFKKILEETK